MHCGIKKNIFLKQIDRSAARTYCVRNFYEFLTSATAVGAGGTCDRGAGACMARGHVWQERRPLQRKVRILLECSLVNGVFYEIGSYGGLLFVKYLPILVISTIFLYSSSKNSISS